MSSAESVRPARSGLDHLRGRRQVAPMVLVMCVVTACATLRRTEDRPPSDHLPAGQLLEQSERVLLPKNVTLRPVFSAGIDLTKISEGWSSRLYNDAAGYCTIGYGHLIKRSGCDGTEPLEFGQGLSRARGEELLTGDMTGAQYTVMTAVTTPMTDGQFAALVDFTFNVGGRNFRGSTLLIVVNRKELDRVDGQLNRWVLANGKPWPGLVTRRKREADLFFDGIPRPRAATPGNEDLAPIDIRSGEQPRK